MTPPSFSPLCPSSPTKSTMACDTERQAMLARIAELERQLADARREALEEAARVVCGYDGRCHTRCPCHRIRSLAATASPPPATTREEGKRCTCGHICPTREERDIDGAECVHGLNCELYEPATTREECQHGKTTAFHPRGATCLECGGKVWRDEPAPGDEPTREEETWPCRVDRGLECNQPGCKPAPGDEPASGGET
jgi:hypothetical protein